MDILLVAQYFGDIENIENSNNRFVYLAGLLAKEHSVEVLTTSFVHARKVQGSNIPKSYNGYKITALSEPGYKKNVCLKRFRSHKILSDNMNKYLETRKKPDVVYCAVPSLDCADVAAKYAKRNNIPFIIDIQDLWPEAFKMVFKVPVIKDILFAPMNKKANFIYSSADYIVGVSETNCNRAKAVNETAELKSVFLGTNLDVFDNNVKRNPASRNDKKLTLGYCGTLGHSYDLRCIFDALELARKQNYNDIEFLVMGSGPLEQDFKQYCADKKIDVQFLGRLPYEKMCGIISSCDICINPISKGSAASIINKHADYAASGRPVINTQESIEYRSLIEKYNCGINCECSNAQSAADAIMYLADNESARKQMGDNARAMAEELFDRKNSYPEILKVINKIVCKNTNCV